MEDRVPLQMQPLQQEPLITPKRKNRQWFILGGILLCAILLVGIGFLIPTKKDTVKSTLSQDLLRNVVKPQVSPTAAPLPFRELTVPYLRERTYSSKLGELEQVYDRDTYTGYLTNYDSDGLKINALLTEPKGEKPADGWPAIVFIHGYIPPTQYQTLEKYMDYIDYLARNGFVVFKIDLRGHGNSEGEPGGGYFGSDYIVDTLNAYAALRSTDFVNPQKIGLWGHSMAGNVILRSVAAKPDIPASVIWGGAVFTYMDREKYGINDNSFAPAQLTTQRQSRRRELFEKHGSPSAQSVFWQQVIPTNYLEDIKGAIALHHAADDSVVNIGYSRDLDILLTNANVTHEFFEYSSGEHNIIGVSFSQAMQRTVDFFKKYL